MHISKKVWSRVAPEDENLLMDVRACKVALLIRGRNAWHGTWVQHFMQNAEMYTTIESAKNGAEHLRAPGNVFYVLEVPALLLLGKITSTVHVETSNERPFEHFAGIGNWTNKSVLGNFREGIYPGVSLRDAARVIENTRLFWGENRFSSRNMLAGHVTSLDDLAFKTRSLQAFRSFGQGSEYLLGWEIFENNFVSKNVIALEKAWNRDLRIALNGNNVQTIEALVSGTAEQGSYMSKSEWAERLSQEIQTTREEIVDARNELEILNEFRDRLANEVVRASDSLQVTMTKRLNQNRSSVVMKKLREIYETQIDKVEFLEKELQEVLDKIRVLQERHLTANKRWRILIRERNEYF